MLSDSLINAISSNYNTSRDQRCFVDNDAPYCILNVTCSLTLVPLAAKTIARPLTTRFDVMDHDHRVVTRGDCIDLMIMCHESQEDARV